jgi:transcription antitermination protein NusB
MATPRDIRRLAFQTLFQLDARGPAEAATIRESLANATDFSESDRRKAFDLAQAAYMAKDAADRAIVAHAPAWPTHRQPAVDRNILRLAHHELSSGRVSASIAINEAVELAKAFGTERSPGFINGVLDRIAKAMPPRTEVKAIEGADAPEAEPAATQASTPGASPAAVPAAAISPAEHKASE